MYEKTIKYVIAGLSKRVNRRVFMSAAAIVVFITTYLLILPAFTQNTKVYCGLEEHQHTEECYETEKTLICKQEEHVGHVHDASCYTSEDRLICSLEESEGHAHSEDCYDEEGNLICGLEEIEGHTHSKECYETITKQTCGQKEEPDHTHSDACYKIKKTLKCDLEEHTHSMACYSNPDADLETQAVWERTLRGVKLSGNWAEDLIEVAETQLGYQESTENYIVDEEGNTKGYTRYGAWYGNEYGDWCAMFVSFCINYAEIPTMESSAAVTDEGTKLYVPIEANCQDWIEILNQKECRMYYALNDKNDYDVLTRGESYEPAAGDLVFFNWDNKNDADHVGIITSYKEATETTPAQITTIEGNAPASVSEHTYKLDNPSIMGFAKLPENPDYDPEASDEATEEKTELPEETEALKSEAEKIEKTVEGDDYTITVKYTEEAKLPEDVELTARELTGSEYEEKLAEAKAAMGRDELTYARFFEITFLSEGKEIEPAAPVEVKITCPETKEISGNEAGKAVHFAEDGTEVLDIQMNSEADGSTSITFEQDSFSVSGIALYDADDEVEIEEESEISLLADESNWSAAPAVGNLTGKVVSAPVVGEWYIMYGYNTATSSHALSETWPNRGSNGGKNAPNPTLSQASNQLGGTVTYTGTEDIAWQYVGDGGFRNRYGYYMYIQTTRSGNFYTGYTYSATFSVTQSPNSTQKALQYSWDKKAFYTYTTLGNYNQTSVYSTIMISKTGYSDSVDVSTQLNYPANVDSTRTNHYLAQVTGLDTTNVANGNHPPTTVTGTAELSKPVLYSLDASSSTMVSVPDVEYTIYNSSGAEVLKVVTKDNIDNIVSGLEPGTYTVSQTAVPEGYVVVSQTKTVTISSEGTGTFGIFYVYKDKNFATDKTGQVIDYVNRIYQVELSAKSGKYGYSVEPLHIDLVVDVSNSMLFPAELNYTGKTVTFNKNGGNVNKTNLDNLNLDKSQTYYFIADNDTSVNAAATSTVYALYWNGSAWVYQDASFYSKAYRHWEKGDEVNVKNAVKSTAGMYKDGATVPSSPSYVNYVRAGDTYDYRDSRGGDVTKSMTGCGAINNSFSSSEGRVDANNHQFKLYTATEYNRLHELQQAVATLGGLVKSFNENSTIRLETFAKAVYDCNEYTMSNQGLIDLISFANNITTQGGTRQDLALKHLIGQQANTTGSTHSNSHLSKNNGQDDYVILITDGAPNTDDAATTINEIKNIATTIKNNYMSGNDRLITVGLSSENIAGDMLPSSASSPSSKYYKQVEKSGDLTKYFIDLFYSELMDRRQLVESTADIVDYVSDSYYITDRNGNALSDGDRINLAGDPDPSGPGYIHYGPVTVDNPDYDPEDEDSSPTITTNEWYVTWDDQTAGTGETASSQVWKGHVYLKAKEDFIGGNTIDSNKSATVTFESSSKGVDLPTPTLNVRLLEMKGFESEETVFLGDDVTGISDKLQTLLNKTVVEKIKNGTGNQLNYKEGATEANGCYTDHFTIPYAIRDLTEAEWTQLLNGESVSIDYTYDDASSHGAVGYFTFSLTREVVDTNLTDCGNHSTTVSGEDVEKYTLTVTYTAYGIGEEDKTGTERETNVHNGENGPGTEVGTGSDIPHGKGTESVDEIHHVHVIDGEIFLTKVIDESMVKKVTQTFKFNLYRTNPETGAKELMGEPWGPIEVEVAPDSTEGTGSVGNLPRGEYTIEEIRDEKSDYAVKSVEVETEDTVCTYGPYDENSKTLEFDIGTNEASDGINPDHNVIIYNQNAPVEENSAWVNGERYVYSKPFKLVDEEMKTGYHTERIPETTYDWSSGTIISTDISGDRYVKLNSTTEALEQAHTSYGILTQVENDNWTIEWHNWTSRQEQTTVPGEMTYTAVRLTYYQQAADDFSAYTNGGYYYYTGSEYKEIASISDHWTLDIVTTDGMKYEDIPITGYQGTNTRVNGQWENRIWYDSIYRGTRGADQISYETIWSESTSTVTAESSKIPTTTTYTEIQVPNEVESDDSISTTISYAHGKIWNMPSIYKLKIPVMKYWGDGNNNHQDDEVYVVLYDKESGTPVKDGDFAKMLKLGPSSNPLNDWCGEFEVTLASNPGDDYVVSDHYEIREVADLSTSEHTDWIQAKVTNDSTDTNSYYVTVANEKDLVTVNGKTYGVYYTAVGDDLVVKNQTAYELPKTGGPGTTRYTWGGIGLILSALVLYSFSLRRRRERRFR